MLGVFNGKYYYWRLEDNKCICSVKKAVRSVETSLTLYQSTRRNIPEDLSSATLLWEHQMSRFEYSAVSLTWRLLTECAVHLVDFTMYQAKIQSKGAWGLINGRAMSEFISSAYFSPYHSLVQTQPSAVMAYPTLQSYFLRHTVQRLVQCSVRVGV